MVDILLYGSLILVPIFCLAMAKGAQGAGRQYALARLTNIESVSDTIDRQIRLAGTLGLLALAFVGAVVLLFFFAPADSGPWVQLAGGVLSLAANVTLGLAAGIAFNAAKILAKVSERDTIEAQIVMKQRARRRLEKLLSVFFFTVLLGLGPRVHALGAGKAWAWAINVTDSMDPVQREAAIEAMTERALEIAWKLGVESIVVVKAGDADLLSDMIWVSVPPTHAFDDCKKAIPLFNISKNWTDFRPASLMESKATAVNECMARQNYERATLAESRRRFEERLRLATRIVPRADVTTRIVPILQTLVRRPYISAVDAVTDLQDHSGVAPESLEIPDGKPVTIVVTRPNPRRTSPTVRDVVTSAERWARVNGITVIGAPEYPGCAHSGEAR